MPHKAPRPCSVHPWILVSSGTGCPLCVTQPVLERPRLIDHRPNASQRGYGPDWKKKRDAYARLHPWCADPFSRHAHKKVKMYIVDHIKRKQDGGSDDDANLQSLCFSCHERKKAIDGSRR